MSLVTTIRNELVARKGDWPTVCRQTKLSYWWVTKFAQGRIENPGVRKLETLQAHFQAFPRDDFDGDVFSPRHHRAAEISDSSK